MSSGGDSDREAVVAALDELDAAFDKVASLSFDQLTLPELLRVLSRLESLARKQPAVANKLISRLAAEASPAELGGTSLRNVLSTQLRIGKAG